MGRRPLTWNSMARSGCLLTLALTWGTGCTLIYGNEVDKKQCKSQADCDPAAATLGTPLVCRQDTCQAPACSQTSECPANSTCVDSLCVAGTADGGTNGVACTQDGDCGSADQRCGFDGLCYVKWACLGEEQKWPPTPVTLSYITTLRSADEPGNPSAIRDVVTEMCSLADPTCLHPVVTADKVTIGADATVSFPLITGSSSSYFVGFARFTSRPGDGGTGSQRIPAYRLFTSDTPLVGDMTDPITINLITPETLELQALITMVPVDSTTSVLQLFLADCGGRPAPGMSVSAPSLPNALFVPLTASGPVLGSNETTVEGTATLLGVPGDRLQTFTIRDEGLQRVITTTLTAGLHAGAMDHIIYYPRNSALQKWLTEAKRRGLLPQ